MTATLGPRNVGRIRAGRQRRMLRRFEERKVVHTYGGHQLQVILTDPMSAAWYDVDWPTMKDLDLLGGARMKAGARVFDVGAHQCVVAMAMAARVGPSGQVVAIEPSAYNCATASRNMAANAFDNLELVQAAVGAEPGSAAFADMLCGHMDDGTGRYGAVTVPVTTIDALASEYGEPDVLFIDVEGYECAVLRGATVVRRSRPDMYVEIHRYCGLEDFGGSVKEVLSYIDRHYTLFVARDELADFIEVGHDGPFPDKRFFLIALA